MAYNPPDIKTIIDRIKTDIKSVIKELNPTDQNTFIYSLVVAMAGLANDNNLQIKLDIIPNSFVTTCKDEEALEPFATLKNVPQKLATGSEGKAVISGLSGTTIPIGTIFLANEQRFRLQSSVSIGTQSIGISEITCNGKTVNVTTVSNHNFASNIQITIAGCDTAEFNGSFIITATDTNKFSYQINTTVTATETSIGTATGTIAVLDLKSIETGASTNLANGDSLAIENQIAGANMYAYTMFTEISGGADDEAFEEWKKRVVYRYQNPITYFNEANVINAVLSIAGNTRCWVKKCTPIVGQATIYFVRDNDANILPDASEIAKAKDAIVALRTVKDSDSDIFVYAPTANVVNFNISDVSPDTPTMKTAIKNSIEQLFADKVNLETNLTLDMIKSAIGNSFDLESGAEIQNYTLNTPSTDIVCSTGELAVLGTITFS